MATEGWITKYALGDSALSADTLGRAAMQDGFVTNAKLEDGTLEVTKISAALLKHLLEVGRIDYSSIDYCKVG